jgi:hypothetical protein
VSGGQCFHNLVSSPANEAIVASVWSKVLGQIAPPRSRTQDPQDAIEHATIIYTRNAARLVRQHRFDAAPIILAEFIAHDSRLQFESLNHFHGRTINLQRSVAEAAHAMNLLPLSGHSGHGRTFCWLDPVANDPSQTSPRPQALTELLLPNKVSWIVARFGGAEGRRSPANPDFSRS